MINTNVKKQYPVIRMPNGHPVSSTMYNRGDLHGVVYSNDIEFDDVLLSNVITTSTVIANLNVSTTVSSNILSSGLLLGSVTVGKLLNSAISTSSNITADTKLTYNLLSSLITSSSVVGNITIPKLVNTSLVSTGTIVADLTVGASIDADAQAFFNRVTTAGGTLSATERTAVNTLVVQMKADGIWTKMKAIYPMVGASAAACAQNLKSSSFTGTFTSGWTFASTGVKGNGTSAYFDTNLNASSSLNNVNNHFSYYSRTQESPLDDRLYGVATSTPQGWQIVPRTTFEDVRFDSPFSVSRIIVANTITTGLFLDTRTSATSHKGFISNSLIGSESSDVSAISFPSFNVYVNARNSAGSVGQFSSKECAMFSIGDGLTDTQASNFYTAVQAFQTTLNRQVN